MNDPLKGGRVWAWAGFALGIVASISANITHSYIVQTQRNDTNIVGPVVSAAFWPLALFLCLEVMSRVMWPHGWVWWLVRYIGLSLVSGIAAVVSWRHMSALLALYGEDDFIAIIGPVAIDGLMTLCSAALLAIADNVKRRLAETPYIEQTAIRLPIEPDMLSESLQDQLPSPVVQSVTKRNRLAVPKPARTVPALPPPTFRTGDDLLEAARTADSEHRAQYGRPITRDGLRAALHIGSRKASEALIKLKGERLDNAAVQHAGVATEVDQGQQRPATDS